MKLNVAIIPIEACVIFKYESGSHCLLSITGPHLSIQRHSCWNHITCQPTREAAVQNIWGD